MDTDINHTLLDAIHTGIFVLHTGTIQYANRAAQQLMGCTLAELQGRLFTDFSSVDLDTDAPDWSQPPAPLAPRVLHLTSSARPPVRVQLSAEAWTNDAAESWLVTVHELPQATDIEIESQKNLTRLRELGQIARIGVWEFDMATQRTYWTEEIYQIYEVPFDFEYNAQTALAFYTPETAQILQRTLGQWMQGSTGDVEIPVTTAKQRPLWIRVMGRPEISNGSVTRLRGTIQDITAVKQTELALRASEALFKNAFEISPIGMSLTGIDASWLKVNRALYEMMGYSEAELLRSNFKAITQPDDVQPNLVLFDATLRGERDGYRMEKRYIHHDGHIIYAVVNTKLLRDDAGNPMYFVSLIEDVTHRRAFELALVDSEERYRLLAEHTTDLVALLAPDGRFLYASPSHERLLGYDPDELLGTPISDLMHPTEVAAIRETTYQAYLRQEALAQQEFRLRTKDGDYVWFEMHATHIPDQGETRILSISRDIHERKRMELALLEREKLHIALDKERELHELKTTMMIRISHEFRTPLAVIGNSADMLERYANRLTDEQRQHRIHQIRKQIHNIANMLDDIMLVLQGILSQTSIQREPFDLGLHCQNTVDMLRERHPKQAFILNMEGNLKQINADEELVARILHNLLDNAIKYAPSSTPIKLDARYVAGLVLLRVSDQGASLMNSDKRQLYEPFFRGENAGETPGLGLGLSIVKHAVELHHGSLTISCHPETGTMFSVTLPIPEVKPNEN